MVKYNTLDLDEIDREKLDHIQQKIEQCKQLLALKVSSSTSKGYHVRLLCKIDCDLCRFVFDDFRRYGFDQQRNTFAQNVLFHSKDYHRVIVKKGNIRLIPIGRYNKK